MIVDQFHNFWELLKTLHSVWLNIYAKRLPKKLGRENIRKKKIQWISRICPYHSLAKLATVQKKIIFPFGNACCLCEGLGFYVLMSRIPTLKKFPTTSSASRWILELAKITSKNRLFVELFSVKAQRILILAHHSCYLRYTYNFANLLEMSVVYDLYNELYSLPVKKYLFNLFAKRKEASDCI